MEKPLKVIIYGGFVFCLVLIINNFCKSGRFISDFFNASIVVRQDNYLELFPRVDAGIPPSSRPLQDPRDNPTHCGKEFGTGCPWVIEQSNTVTDQML